MGVERFLFVLYIEYSHFVLFAKPFFFPLMAETHQEHTRLLLNYKIA